MQAGEACSKERVRISRPDRHLAEFPRFRKPGAPVWARAAAAPFTGSAKRNGRPANVQPMERPGVRTLA